MSYSSASSPRSETTSKHKALSRLFSTVCNSSREGQSNSFKNLAVSRKSSVPTSLLVSAPVLTAASVGDRSIGNHMC
ncbi:hypothetical protein DdX_02163 [Ditylenchus destructor]|uniref:Uncharacterized protein n=1 Tax=Ditylenchus destructor TaxID=166010 RepID=A0AAD4NEE1_9BILA|nr:hypothetical protein DdX_02163 [Ditylenchus destructor]